MSRAGVVSLIVASLVPLTLASTASAGAADAAPHPATPAPATTATPTAGAGAGPSTPTAGAGPGAGAGDTAQRERAWPLPDKLHRTINVRRLREGPPPTIPWIVDTAIHHGESSIPLGAEPDSFVQLNEGYVVRTRLDDQDSTWRLDFVRTDGESTELARGAVSVPAAKRDHTWVMWTRAGFEPGGAKTVYYASAQEDGIVYDPGLGVLTDADYTPVGFVNEEYGFLMNAAGWTDAVQAWDLGGGTASFPSELGVTAVSQAGNYASFIRRYDEEDRPCATIVTIDSWFVNDRWESCEIYPVSFSLDGRYAVAIDSRTDGLGPSSLVIVDAATGKRRLTLDVGLTQQVRWESDGRLLFDAWTGNQLALVRCTVSGACERATPIRRHDAGEDPRSPFILPRQ